MPLPARNCAWMRFSTAALIRARPAERLASLNGALETGMDALADHASIQTLEAIDTTTPAGKH